MCSAPKTAREIFTVAVEQYSPDQWSRYLDEACGDDVELRKRVDLLLEAHVGDESILDNPAVACPTVEQPPITEKPGTQIGPYKLLQQIGEGGMGVVYMAEQKEPVKRRVALKIIKPGMDTRQVIARFEAERQALAMMDHPNIAKVLDAGQTESGRPYFVMELVNGLPVTKYCDEQHLTPKERLELFVPICQAVQHAHQKGIIHRDLKPSNILVALYDGQPVPKVIDFGVAKATSQTLTEKTMFTQLGQVVGTLEYMSPEQAERNQLDIDTRSDIYSLGVVLYELLTGETPFDRARLRSAAFDEMLRIIREEEPSKPSTKVNSSQSLPSIAANRRIEPAKLGSMIRGELDWIVLKAMEKDRGRRYETASKFAEDVQHYLNDEAVVACPPSRSYKFGKFARRNKAVIGTATAIAASLIAGLIGTSWQTYRATIAERDAIAFATDAKEQAERAKASEKKTLAEMERADREAEKARTEAAISKAINQFLNKDLLGLTYADNQSQQLLKPDPDLKVRVLLDRASNKIEGRFEDQPRVERALRQAIGDAFRGIDASEEAEKHLKRALDLDRQNSWDATANLDLLCRLYLYMQRYDEAYEMAQEAYETSTRMRGEESTDTSPMMLDLANAYMMQQKFAEAQSLLSHGIEIRRRSSGDDDVETMKWEHNLAVVFGMQGDEVKATQLLEDLLIRRQQILPAHNIDVIRNQTALATGYINAGQYEKAESILRDAATVLRSTRGDHIDTLSCEQKLAGVLAMQNKYPEATTLGQSVLETCETQYGRDDPRAVMFRQNLATDYANSARDLALTPDGSNLSRDEIIKLAQQAVQWDPQSATNQATLGFVHSRFLQWEQATKVFEELVGDQPQRTGPYGFTAAIAYWKSGRREEAREQYAVCQKAMEEGEFPGVEMVRQSKMEADAVMSQDASDSSIETENTGEAINK